MFLLRHGQSEFNLHFTRTRRDPGIEDPRLTEAGLAQARAAGAALAGRGIRRIVASPYTRALQTAEAAAVYLGAPVEIDVLARERFAFRCDVGSRRAILARDWPDHDFSGIEEVWWPDRMEPEPEVIARAARFRDRMAGSDDAAATLVVSHWGFILALTGRSVENGDWMEYDPATPAPAEVVWRH